MTLTKLTRKSVSRQRFEAYLKRREGQALGYWEVWQAAYETGAGRRGEAKKRRKK